jgi:hypothetical protein
MGRMKELFMQMREQEEEQDPYDGLDDEYWQDRAKWQELYEKEMREEMNRDAELPDNKKIPPCSAHDFEDPLP